MTMQYLDGFDHYNTAQIGSFWGSTYLSEASSVNAISAGNGRNSTASYRSTHRHLATSDGAQIIRTLTAQATWTVGFSYKISSIAERNQIFAFMDAGSNQIELEVQETTGFLVVTRSGTVIATGTSAALTAGVVYYIEFKATIHNSTGSFEVRVNGVAVTGLTLSSQDTQSTANATANQIKLGGRARSTSGSAVITHDYDDLYVLDSNGSLNNTFLGDYKVETLFPTGAGNYAEWTASAGSNFQCVDENPATDDTDFVSTSTVNNRDTYAFGNLTTATGNVAAVMMVIKARKDDAGSRSIAAMARRNGVDAVAATQAIADAYAEYFQMWEQDPTNVTTWTPGLVNDSEFGHRLIV